MILETVVDRSRRMKIAIVDDEPPARAKLRRFLEDLPNIEIVLQAADGRSALTLIAAQPPDAVFLDIQMPGLSGLEVAASLPAGVAVVFTTAYDEYAVRAFDINAVDYLLKPVTRERLIASVERLRLRLSRGESGRQRQGLLGALHGLQPVAGHWLVPQRSGLARVDLSAIECIAAADNYIELHSAQRSYLDRVSFAAFLAHPAAAGFVQVHRSFAINLAHIAAVAPLAKGDAELTLTSGRRVRLSRRFRDALRGTLPARP